MTKVFIPPYPEQQWDKRVIVAIEERIRQCSHPNELNTVRVLPVLPQFPQPLMAKRVNP